MGTLAAVQILMSVARDRQAVILFAHHAGDQAETIAMRLLKGSGLIGLAGIPSPVFNMVSLYHVHFWDGHMINCCVFATTLDMPLKMTPVTETVNSSGFAFDSCWLTLIKLGEGHHLISFVVLVLSPQSYLKPQ